MMSNKKNISLSIVIIFFLLILVSSCSKPLLKPDSLSEKVVPVSQEFFQRGIASWYGKKFHNKRTANTEVYNMYRLTAAHKQLPFNTFVKVTNLTNNKSVIVRINDRGPFVKGRIIDLSLKAATKIGMADSGTAEVKLFIVNKQKSNHKITKFKIVKNDPFQYTFYIIQAGAFSRKNNAESILKTIQNILPDHKFIIKHLDGFFKVVSKKKIINSMANSILSKLKKNNISAYKKQIFDY